MNTITENTKFNIDLKKHLENLNTLEFKLFIKDKLNDLINKETYEIKEINVKESGLLIDAFYYYIPSEKPENIRIVIKDISDGINSENVLFYFDK